MRHFDPPHQTSAWPSPAAPDTPENLPPPWPPPSRSHAPESAAHPTKKSACSNTASAESPPCQSRASLPTFHIHPESPARRPHTPPAPIAPPASVPRAALSHPKAHRSVFSHLPPPPLPPQPANPPPSDP